MKKWFQLCLCVVLMGTLFACTKEEDVIPEPTINVQETMKLYLEAMQRQDGVAMSEYTVSGKGDNFAISTADAESMGLSEESAKKLVEKLLSFDYIIGDHITTADTNMNSITVDIQSYDIFKILDDTVKENQKTFAKIQKGKESDEEKAQMITDILLASFDEAPKEKGFTYQFDFMLIDNVWKIKDDNINDFYTNLVGTQE